ncbi:hypothetical protein GGR52DRAFT_583709 [Hypoxylon sp. FL1284]|nr:hypothetical protein GGR52DRAFT_583709 [Hypoxylon sp. FL1284]
MQFTTASLFALLGLASAQKVHVVSVSSANKTLAFYPDNLKADVGDMVQFQFRSGNHSVVQSTFDKPCAPMNENSNMTGMFSGYMNVAASASAGSIPTYTIMVANKTPMWLYCSQGKHCQSGMVMVINENTGANATRSLSNFKDIASKETSNTAPSSAFGGSSGNSTSGPGSGSSTGGSSGSGSGSGTGSTGSDATQSGSPSGASGSAVPTAGAVAVGASSSMGLLGLAAAFFML